MQHEPYDDLQRGAQETATHLARAAAELGAQAYYRHLSQLPVKVQVSPAREEVARAQQALQTGVNQDHLWESIRHSPAVQSFKGDQEQYAQMIWRKAQIEHAVAIASPGSSLTQAPRHTL